MDNQFLYSDPSGLFHKRPIWHPPRRIDPAVLVVLHNAAPVELTVSPSSEATIAVAADAPAILDENTLAPADPSTITIETSAPTLSTQRQIDVTPADPATVLVSTEAPGLDQIREITVSPASEATVSVSTQVPTWVTDAAAIKWPVLLTQVRSWVQYGDEAYGKNVIYRRKVAIPMTPQPRRQAAAEATITLLTEAPTLVTESGTERTVTPGVGAILVAEQTPELIRTNPTNSVVPLYRRTWMQQPQYHVSRRPAGPTAQYGYRVQWQYAGERLVVRDTTRDSWYDAFANEKTRAPGGVTITVEADAPTLLRRYVVSPSAESTIAVSTVAPSVEADGEVQISVAPTVATIAVQTDVPVAATEIEDAVVIVNTLSAARRRQLAWRQEYTQRQEMATRIIYTYSNATPDTLRSPDTGTISVSTEAPSVVFLNALTISPSSPATIAVETEEPALSAQAENQPSTGSIIVKTEAPTIVGAIGTITVSPSMPARIVVDTDAPDLQGVDTTVFPGGDGVEATSVLVKTGTPTLRLIRWTREAEPVDNWTAESTAVDSWEKEPAAAGGWNKV